jgi:hypothetical protein
MTESRKPGDLSMWVFWVAIAPGLCLALLVWSTTAIIVVWTLTAFSAGVLHLLTCTGQTGDPAPADELIAAAAFASQIGLAGVALGATLQLAPVLALIVAAVLVGLSRRVRRTSRRLLTRTAAGGDDVPRSSSPLPVALMTPVRSPTAHACAEPDGDASMVAAMTTSELCVAWRISYTALQHSRIPREQARWVTLRQAYLDEIEARSPTALTAWLASGARAASNPSRFLRD